MEADGDADTRERLQLSLTIEARLDPDLARTLVRSPRQTIQPARGASARGLAALDALRKLGASTDGRLDLHHTLGEGGMGVVHLATQTTMGRHVAVKTRRGTASDEEGPADPVDATLRILREAWIMGALEHPNVVPVYDVGVDAAGAPVIVMKRIEGRSWAELMGAPDEIARRFGAADALEWNLRILISACNAIHFAHSRGILHRDLKPENVMIGAFGEVYVLDWGIAVSLEPDPSGRLPAVSEATDIVGTPAYMAPEMVMGDPSLLSPRTDVYLLGAILYEIATGRPPHDGPTVHAMLSSVLLSTPGYDGVPSEVEAICARALHRDPKDRYESAEAMRLALEALLQQRGSRRLALEAEDSLRRLHHALSNEPPGEERALAAFHLLGECRFGYRAALAAWPENHGARSGLDQALLAVVDHELGEGDPGAAAALLREVSSPPPDLIARVEAAIRTRADEDVRLRRLDEDADPRVGSRTRTFLSLIFGVFWVVVPIGGWIISLSGRASLTHELTLGWSVFFFVLSLAVVVWARDTLTKTRFNRRLSATLSLHLGTQVVLAGGAWVAGVRPELGLSLMMFGWAVVETMLGVWVEPWFGVPAALAGLSFLISTAWPASVLPLMAAHSLVLTLVIVLIWFPRQDLARMIERRREMRRRARKWLLDMGRGPFPQGARGVGPQGHPKASTSPSASIGSDGGTHAGAPEKTSVT
jgi:serine/threonine-protein kinase